MASSSSKGKPKRKAEDSDSDMVPQAKRVATGAVFSIFEKRSITSGTLQWLPKLGTNCLHGIHLVPKSSSKVAMFDVDGTLITPTGGRRHPKDAEDWQWWNPRVKNKLNDIAKEGFSIIFISNQGGFKGKNGIIKATEWKKKLLAISHQLPDVPFRVLAAGAYDEFRKPLPGTWKALEEIFGTDGIKIDKANSFFVGDAAGRPNDHESTDRKYALNLGVPFLTPEEYFLEKKAEPFTLAGFHPSSLIINGPPIPPDLINLIPKKGTSKPEIVLFVGYPSTGKSTFFNQHFAPAGYTHVNQDILKSRGKCLKVVDEAIVAGNSAVVDNTNRDCKTRKEYIDLAKKLKVNIRCIHFDVAGDLAYHNNIYRAFLATSKPDEPRRTYISKMIYDQYTKQYEAPSLEEGFSALIKLPWVFAGTKADHARWNIWAGIMK